MKDRTSAEPPTLDIFTANSPLNALTPHVLDNLLQFKPGYLKPAEFEVGPALAESWEWSPDGLQITLRLRQGAKWHNKPPVNGRVFDAADVLFTWDRFSRKSSNRSAIVNSINPEAPIVSITSTDSRTIVVKLKEPLVYALGLFADDRSGGMVTIPKETDSTLDPRADMIGMGPFVLSGYTPSVGFTLKRHPDYFDPDHALVEQIDLPIISEYASALAQFKAGNLHTMGSRASGVRAEEVLVVKREEPRLNIFQGDIGASSTRLIFGWLPAGKSPFLDERVRQAVSMSFERDLYNDTFNNVSGFEAEGLPVETRWNTALAASTEGWWLNPQGNDFGPNSRYFKHDIAEAKKLLAAAGYPSGIKDMTTSYVTGPELAHGPTAEVLNGMIAELGITYKVHSVDYASEYIPRFRDGRGQFEGWAYKVAVGGGAAGGGDAVGALANEYWSKSGVTFHGFDVGGKGDGSGDPQVDTLIEKARLERDTEKRRALVFDLQRHLGKTWYAMPMPAAASGFVMAWPCVANYRVFPGSRYNYRLWIDDQQPPFKSA
jgi:ABC-type transport system substrate-binding protein